MKKFAIYAFALLATATTLTSCGDDEETTVTPTAPAVEAYSAKILGAQSASAGSFFSTTTGVVYLTSDSSNFATNNVNVSFAQTGATFTPKFISLDTRKTEGLTRVVTNNTATFFRESTMTKAQFDTAAASIGKISAASAKTINVSQSKVYEVVTVGSTTTRALMYVSNLSAPTTGATGSVTIDVRRLK